MKRLLLFPLLLLLLGCQEKFSPAPVIGPAAFVIKEFGVEGLNNDNIKISDRSIIIKLPANYPNSGLIKPTIKLRDGFSLQTNLDNGLDYEGKNISITAESASYGTFTYSIYVIPADALVLTPDVPGYELTISEGASITIPVSKLGTLTTINDSGMVAEHPVITLKEKSTGKLNTAAGSIVWDLTGKNRIKIDFPITISAGDYEATVVWGKRKAVVNAPLKIKYGKLALSVNGWTATKENPRINIQGINITPENSYEMILENDFTEPRKLGLVRNDYNSLQAEIPSDLEFGNYKSTILVNGNKYGVEQTPVVPSSYANFFYKRSIEQPTISFTSQPSYFYSGICSYYTPTSKISRSEELVTQVGYPREWGESEITLRFTDIKNGATFDLKKLGSSTTIMCSYQTTTRFKILDTMPDSDYSIVATVDHYIDGKPSISSEKFPQIVTIKN